MEGVRRTPRAPACAGGSETCWRRRHEPIRALSATRLHVSVAKGGVSLSAVCLCAHFVQSLGDTDAPAIASQTVSPRSAPPPQSTAVPQWSTYLSGRSCPAVSARMCRVPTLSGPQCAPAAMALGRFTSRAFRVRQGSRTCPLRLKLVMLRAVRPPLHCTAHDRTGVTAAAATIAERRCMEVWAAWRCRKRSA